MQLQLLRPRSRQTLVPQKVPAADPPDHPASERPQDAGKVSQIFTSARPREPQVYERIARRVHHIVPVFDYTGVLGKERAAHILH